MEEAIKANFLNLVTTFYIASWQQMGKVANPMTNKIERNLEQAQYSIDMLVMLRDKTKGNLTPEETQILDQSIANLQMNYIEELNVPEKKEDKTADSKSGENKKETT